MAETWWLAKVTPSATAPLRRSLRPEPDPVSSASAAPLPVRLVSSLSCSSTFSAKLLDFGTNQHLPYSCFSYLFCCPTSPEMIEASLERDKPLSEFLFKTLKYVFCHFQVGDLVVDLVFGSRT